MGAEVCGAAQTAMGEHLTTVGAEEGYRLWSGEYDRAANPLLAVEMRLLRNRLGPLAGRRFLDAGAGTGRWMKFAASQGARAFGVDLSAPMLEAAGGLGSLVRGDVRRLPFANGTADLAVCSFVLGYVREANDALAELARVAQCVVVSDLHPAAFDAGWTRSFRAKCQVIEIENFRHSLQCPNGFVERWSLDGHFGEPERGIFEAAGKGHAFESLAAIPAIRAVCWQRE